MTQRIAIVSYTAREDTRHPTTMYARVRTRVYTRSWTAALPGPVNISLTHV